ncbi:MAG TPA: glycosyltransferase family 2 protein [Bacteroidia bacterium]|nr:glycosyltransferase family 2 protein [Bacteroidia bacterium]
MLVSVVIPCYNVENYIAQCLQALLAQQYKDLQIICVNNNSTDSTLSILTRFATEHSSLITLVEELQKGAPYARNRGLQEVHGEYVQFLDADDLLEPEKIAHQVNLIKNNNFPDFIAANYYRESVEGNKKLHQVHRNDFWLGLLYTQLGITSANIFKTSSVKSAGAFDVTLKSSQEYALMFSIMRLSGKVCADARALTIVRDRKGGSITQQNVAENLERYLHLRIRILKYLEENVDKSKMQPYYQALFDAIRVLYKHNKDASIKAFKENLPKSFKPTSSAATTASYCLLFRIFGFENTEKIKSAVK